MKKSIALGITLTGIGAALFGAFSLYKLTKEEQVNTDIDINIGNDVDVDMDEDIGSGNNVEVKVLEPDVKDEDITPLSDEAMKTDKQWDPDEEPVALTPEELDKLGNVNPLDNNTNLF